MQSHLFRPYRSVGHICASLPFHYHALGTARFLLVPLHHSFLVYNLDRLRVTLTSQPVTEPLTAITAAGRDVTVVAAGSGLYFYKRNEIRQRIEAAAANHPITMLRSWGADHVLSVDDGQTMKVWQLSRLKIDKQREVGEWEKVKKEDDEVEESKASSDGAQAGELETDEQMSDVSSSATHPACIASISLRQFDLASSSIHLPSNARLTCWLHPPTYINKLLLGFSTGLLLLYNVNTRQPIHAYYPVKEYIDSRATQPTAASSALSTTNPTSSASSSADHSAASLTCLAASPSPGVISIGTSTGLILQYDIDAQTAPILSSFQQHTGTVTTLSYRTDGTPHLLSGSTDGHLLCWQLGEWMDGDGDSGGDWKRRPGFHSMVRWAHEGRIVSAMYLPQEPLVISSSTDNALRLFSCEGSEGAMRLLKARAGHQTTARCVRFMAREEDGGKSTDMMLLTGGEEGAMRMWSLRREEESRELGQRKLGGKSRRQLLLDEQEDEGSLSAITSFSFTVDRHERDYSNVLSAHSADMAAHLWSTATASVSTLSLLNPLVPLSPVSAVEVSACGQYGVVGRKAGRVEVYAMQSGAYRGGCGEGEEGKSRSRRRRRKGELHTLDDLIRGEQVTLWGNKKATEAADEDEEEETKEAVVQQVSHTAEVTGVQVDGMNRWIVSASLDGTVKVWDFNTRHLLHTLTVARGSGVSRLLYHRDNDLFVVATDDYQLLVYDASSVSATQPPTLIRHFRSHRSPITDLCFSPRGHLLLSSGLGCVLLVHHLPSALLLDVLHFSAPIVSMSFSPLGDMIATAHAGTLAVQLWWSKEWVGEGWDEAEVRHGEGLQTEEDEDETEEDEAGVAVVEMQVEGGGEKEATSRRSGLITFSSLPRNRWHALLHWDDLKERNRAKGDEVKRNQAAPFFLSTLDIPTTRTAPSQQLINTTTDTANKTNKPTITAGRVLHSGGILDEPAAIQLLRSAQRINDGYSAVMAHLLQLTPSQLDGLLVSLSPHPHSVEYLLLFVNFFVVALSQLTQYEFVQSVLARFLRLHGVELSDECGVEGREGLKRLVAEQRKGWERLERGLLKSQALVNHLARMA